MSINLSEVPSEITIDVWGDYAKRGKIDELDEALVKKFGLIQPEAFSSVNTSPADYAEKLRDFLVEEYKMGEDKLRDMYVLRRISIGLAEVKQKLDNGTKLFTDLDDFDKGIADGFAVLVDKFSATYGGDFDDPELFISIFEPVMQVLSREIVAKPIRTFANTEASVNKIMEVFNEEYSKK